jgi:hypothetical protein
LASNKTNGILSTRGGGRLVAVVRHLPTYRPNRKSQAQTTKEGRREREEDMADPAAAVEEVPAEGAEGGEAVVAAIEPIGPETLAAHLKIATAFRVFDHEQNNTVDVRWVVVPSHTHTAPRKGALGHTAIPERVG